MRKFAWYLALAATASAVAVAAVNLPAVDAAHAGPSKPKRFKRIYEPSGAQVLPDGRVLIVEDEAENPVSLLQVRDDRSIRTTRLRPASILSLLSGGFPLADTEDVEGVDVGPDGFVYVITSHSRTEEGRRSGRREKLVRFRIEGDRMFDAGEIVNLRKHIGKKFPKLKAAAKIKDVKNDNGLNVEALSFDRAGTTLWIAFRSPVIKGQALIVEFRNPRAVFETGEKPVIGDDLIRLDLAGGGIRAITFDPYLDGFLILSRREDKKGKAFKLWLWDGSRDHEPRRLDVDMKGDLDNAEGVTPVMVGDKRFLLVVFDDGIAAKGKGGHYILLDYADIRIRDGA